MKSALTSEKKMTLKEVAEATGAAYRTVAEYAQKAGWTRNGRKTFLDERQVTAILEAMKTTSGQGQNIALQDNLQALETAFSPILQLKIIQEQKDALHKKEIEIYQKELHRVESRAINAEAALGREVLAHRETKTGLETYQRIAESAGLTLTDRDDILANYRRR